MDRFRFRPGVKGKKKNDPGWSQVFGKGGFVAGGFDQIGLKSQWNYANDLDDFSQNGTEIQELNSMLEFENSFDSESY